MEATLAKFEKQMARAKKAGTDTSKGLEAQFANSNKKMAQSAETSAIAIGKEMDRLRAKYDPMFAASKRYEAALEELNRAQKVGALNTRQYEDALERLNADYAQATNRARRLAGASADVGRTTRGMGGGLQNVAFQVGDFATQVGAGTSASVALGQQLPQLLGGFGALGAVMGAAVAIGVPLAANFIDLGDSAEGAADKVDTLEESVDRLESSIKAASSAGRDDLVESFGAVTSAVLALVDAEKQLSLLEAAKNLRETREALAGFTDVGWLDSLRGFSDTAEGTLRKVQHEFGLTEEQAKQLLGAFEQLAAAEGPRNIADAFARVRGELLDAVGGYEKLNMEQIAFLESLKDAERAAREMAKQLDDAETNLLDVAEAAYAAARGFAAALPNVDTLLGRVQDLAKAAWDYAGAMGAAEIHSSEQGRRGARDPREFGGSAFDWQVREGTEFLDNYTPPRSLRSGSGRSKKRDDPFGAEEEIAALDRKIQMIGKETAEIAKLETKYALLDEAKRRGIDLDSRQTETGETVREQIERQADSVGKLTEKYEQAKERAEFFDDAQQQLKDGIIDAIIEGENLAGVLENLAKAFAKAALEAALFGSGPFGGSGGGLLGGFVGGIFNANGNAIQGGRVVPFASGGVVSSPTAFPMAGRKVGVMGESGPEGIMPLTRMANGKLGVQSRGGGSDMNVVINNYDAGNNEMRQTHRQGPNGEELVIDVVNRGVARGDMDKSFGSRYGAKSKKVSR
ncbi:phage tail tape measure protein [Roseovarius indicus]|nr:phage tail tape measure protein [Roseovarius indicus]